MSSPTTKAYTGKDQQKQVRDEGLSLKPYSLIEGTVSHVNQPGGHIYVKTGGSVQPVPCSYTNSFMGTLMGFSANYAPPKGTGVVVFYTGQTPSYIIGEIPKVSIIPQGQNNTVTSGDSFAETKQSEATNHPGEPIYNQSQGPLDLVEGEIQIGNAAGIALVFLRHLTMLSAGDLASVQCHLLDDMVRIVSDKWSHITAFGDHEIFNDRGKLNAVWRGTTRDFEALGNKEGKQERKAEANNNDIDPEDSVEDKWRQSGRWRFQKYVGYLGEFINMFVSDPVGNLADAADSAFTSGNFRVHINDDGSLLVQSVGDIILERVHKIAVPVEIQRYDDPEREIDETIGKDPLANWIPNDKDKLFEVAYQLRDHGRWFSNLYTLARFHISDNYKVPDDVEIEQGDKDGKDPEKTEANSSYSKAIHELYLNKYSTFRILRDGSIVCHDGYGSAITMAGGDVTVSAIRNLKLEAANHVIINSGNDVIVNARRHIEMVAKVGGLLLRGTAWVQALCDKGTLLLQSTAIEGPVQDDIQPKIIGDSGVVIKGGQLGAMLTSEADVKIVASRGNILMKSLNFFGSFRQKMKVNLNFELSNSGLTVSGKSVFEQVQTTSLAPWAYLTPTGAPAPIILDVITRPDVVTRITATLAQLRANAKLNTSGNLKTPSEGFEHRDDYDGADGYESLTQQHLRVEDMDNYETDNTALQGRAGKPYPGGAEQLAYNPSNRNPLSKDTPSNSTLSNEAGDFTKTSTSRYLKPNI